MSEQPRVERARISSGLLQTEAMPAWRHLREAPLPLLSLGRRPKISVIAVVQAIPKNPDCIFPNQLLRAGPRKCECAPQADIVLEDEH